MRIVIGNDRKGLAYKIKLRDYLIGKGYDVLDVGTCDDVPCDYPVYAYAAAEKIKNGVCEKGILICSSGVGISIAANKVNGIRCGIGYSDEVAKLMRMHNNANIIAFGQDFMDYSDVQKRVDIFLHTDFLGDYHQTRINQISYIENTQNIQPSK